MTNVGDPKEEYKDLSDNMRHYANMRFAQLTIFVALTGALIVVNFSKDAPDSHLAKTVLKVAGIFIATMFWIMEERAADYWHHFRKRAVELEDLLGYRQYKDRPTRRFLTATNASRAIYVGVIVFWISALIWHGMF
jgi:dipeptide/tripeptide permease